MDLVAIWAAEPIWVEAVQWSVLVGPELAGFYAFSGANSAWHSQIVVAPVTRTIRQIPTEVSLGLRHGLPDDCVASFDNLQPIRRSFLTQRAGELQIDERDEICRALRALADC